jgi:hypothetical protein
LFASTLPLAAIVATEQPNIPSPIIPLRPVIITEQAEAWVFGERMPQQTATILNGPPAAL